MEKELRDCFHSILNKIQKLSIGSSSILRVADKKGFIESPSVDNTEHLIKVLKLNKDTSKDLSVEILKLKEIIYKEMKIDAKEG
jgi:hypothetical protein